MIDFAAVKATVDFVAVAQSRMVLKKLGNRYVGLCPFHAESTPSFDINQSKQVALCRGCNWTGDVFDFISKLENISTVQAAEYLSQGGFTPIAPIVPAVRAPTEPEWRSQPPPIDNPGPKSFEVKGQELVKVWRYNDAEGALLGFVVRYRKPDGKKDFRPWTYGYMSDAVRAQPHWAMHAWSKPRPLYGLDLLALDPTAQVIVVEGEKAADAGRQLFPHGIAVSWPGGSTAAKFADWSPLYGRDVVVIPDNDVTGRTAAWWVCDRLLENGAKVAIIEPDQASPPSWDIADGLEEGWTPDVALRWARERKQAWPIERPEVSLTAATPALAVVGGTDVGDRPAFESIAFSDTHLGRAFVMERGAYWRFEAKGRTWWQWDGNRWRIDETLAHVHDIRQFLSRVAHGELAQQLTPKQQSKLEGKTQTEATAYMVQCDPAIAAHANKWDLDPWQLVTPEGTVELKTGTLRPSVREDMNTRCTAVAPEPGPTPLWDAWLATMTCGDAELLAYLKRLAGYCLTGSVDEQMFAFFYGPGGNGKGTFIRVLKAILEDYATTARMEAFMEQPNEMHSAVIVALKGFRLVDVQEAQQHKKLDVARIKNLTGGDAVSANKMRQEYETFMPQCKLIFAANHKPAMRVIDRAIARRLHLVPWNYSIPDAARDQGVENRIKATELPQILAWAIEGCLEWQRMGLKPPRAVMDASAEFLAAEDAIGTWMAYATQADPHGSLLSRELYGSYAHYLESQKLRPLTEPKFREDLQLRGLDIKRTGGVYLVYGLAFSKAETDRLRQERGEGWMQD